MQIIDIVITVLLVIGLISGLRNGLVKQVAGLAGLIGGLLLGRALYMPVGAWLEGVFGMSVEVSRIMAFVLMLIIVPLFFSMAGWLVEKLLRVVSLNWVNHLLGGLVCVLKFALFVGVVIIGIELFDSRDMLVSEEKKEESVLYYPLRDITSIFFGELKKDLGDNNWL